MGPVLQSIVSELVARHEQTRRIDLNDIAEVIGTRAVSYDDVDHVIRALEEMGCRVGGPPTLRELELIREVVVSARALREELGRAPAVEEIAARAKHAPFVVRRALENAQSLGAAASRGD